MMFDEMLEGRIEKPNTIDSTSPVIAGSSRRTYSIGDIMRILDISRSTAYLLVKKKLFRSVKLGNQIRISKTSFDTWLDVG